MKQPKTRLTIKESEPLPLRGKNNNDQATHLYFFLLLVFLYGCMEHLKSKPSCAWDEQECFVLNDLKEDRFHTVSRMVLEDISNMQTEELRSILKVLRKNMDNPTIKHGKIEKIHDNLSRLKSFSYLGWNPVENNESSVPLYLHKTFVDYSNGDIASRIGFSIQEKKGDALHFDDIVVLDDTKISTPAEIDIRQVVRFDDSFHHVPLDYLIVSDSAYCSKRTEIVQK